MNDSYFPELFFCISANDTSIHLVVAVAKILILFFPWIMPNPEANSDEFSFFTFAQ